MCLVCLIIVKMFLDMFSSRAPTFNLMLECHPKDPKGLNVSFCQNEPFTCPWVCLYRSC